MTTDPTLGLPVVYLVDDEEVVRDALAWLLRSRRLLAEGFASADAFAAWLAGQTAPQRPPWPAGPACLVLDMRMPGTSGLALFEDLADRGWLPLLPVIFLAPSTSSRSRSRTTRSSTASSRRWRPARRPCRRGASGASAKARWPS